MPSSIIIIGAGPNLGAAVARRFGREGLSVGLVARDQHKLAAIEADLARHEIDAAYATAEHP
jgi:short-subunit dehydrogenase